MKYLRVWRDDSGPCIIPSSAFSLVIDSQRWRFKRASAMIEAYFLRVKACMGRAEYGGCRSYPCFGCGTTRVWEEYPSYPREKMKPAQRTSLTHGRIGMGLVKRRIISYISACHVAKRYIKRFWKALTATCAVMICIGYVCREDTF